MDQELLYFEIRGEWFVANERGDLTQANRLRFTNDWTLLGVSFHHWRNNVDVTFQDSWDNPKRMVGGYLWDIDHGTVRTWGGSYNGKLPKVTMAYKKGE